LLAVSADLSRLLRAIFGHMAFLVAVMALSGKLTRRCSWAVSNQVSLLVAVSAFLDTRVGAVSLVVTRRRDKHGLSFVLMPLKLNLPLLATVEASTGAASTSTAILSSGGIKRSSTSVVKGCCSSSVVMAIGDLPSIIGGSVMPLVGSSGCIPVVSTPRRSPVRHLDL
jgi:hypothetical protein